MKYADCHPDRKHYCKGLCGPCYRTEYRKANADKIAERMIEYYKANSDKIVEQVTEYRKANSDKIVEYQTEYRKANRDKISKGQLKYARANPGKINALSAKRHAAKLQRTPAWLAKDDWLEIQAFYVEAVRKTKEIGVPHHVDHIVPLQGETVSGLHVPWNLRVITAKENLSKGNKF